MTTRHPDFAEEQAYIEAVYNSHFAAVASAREEMRDPGRGGDRWAGHVLQQKARDRYQRLASINTTRLVAGRLDYASGAPGRTYVGPMSISGWVEGFDRPNAVPFWRATDTDTMGLARRRAFDTKERVLLDVSDEVFGVAGDPEATHAARTRIVLDRVAAELEQAREPAMRQIVATIVDDQYRMIEADTRGVFVVQGGPGTGKTAVGLHRAVYLIRTNEGLGRVLVVGPNAAFMAYISQVLPGLGEQDVDQIPIDRLASAGEVAAIRGEDSREVAAVKGDARMAKVIARDLEGRVRPADEDQDFRYSEMFDSFPADRANEILAEHRAAGYTYAEGRRRFREAMRTAAEDILQERLNRAARLRGTRARGLDRADARVKLAQDSGWTSWLERIWPRAGAAALIHGLLTTEQRLREAAGGALTERELAALLARGTTTIGNHPWTRGDLVLIDEAEAAIQEPAAGYGYVIVDEAQDLTPMELRMIARRSGSGDMTLLGDIAQATGPCPHPDWESVIAHLPHESGVREDELTVGYRVPANIMELANRLLPRIAPRLQPTRPVRDAQFEPAFARIAEYELADTVASRVQEFTADERSVGVIVPADLIVEVRGALAGAGIPTGDIATDQLDKRVTLLRAAEAKGLEFDNVVIVEPMKIVVGSTRGWSELYVALTRATQRLAVVHALDLPAPLPGGIEPELPIEELEEEIAEVEDTTEVELDFDLDLAADIGLVPDGRPDDPPPKTAIDEASAAAAVRDTPEPEPDEMQGIDEPDAGEGIEPDRPARSEVRHEEHDGVPDFQPDPEIEVEPEGIADEVAERTAETEPSPGTTPRSAGSDDLAPVPEELSTEDGADRRAPADRRRPMPTPAGLSADFSEAIVFARVVHGNHPRRGTAIPFLGHLLGAAALVIEDGGTEAEAIAALLHDAIEDGPPGVEDTIRSRFGDQVAGIVVECTDPVGDDFKVQKREHMRRLERGSRSARRVSLAEKLDNARALLRDLERYGPEVWGNMNVEPDDLLWYLRSLVALFLRSFPSVLAAEFERAVARIDELAGRSA